jgi:hypothetical protein
MTRDVFNYLFDKGKAKGKNPIQKADLLEYLTDMKGHISKEIASSQKLLQVQMELHNKLDEIERFIVSRQDPHFFIDSTHERELRELLDASKEAMVTLKTELANEVEAKNAMLEKYDSMMRE